MYDPSRPTNVDEYLRSDERIREIREWKALLYRHRGPPAKRQASWDSDDDDGDGERPMNNSMSGPPPLSLPAHPHSPTFARCLHTPPCHRSVRAARFLFLRAAAHVAPAGLPAR